MRRVDFEHEPTIVFARVALDVDAWLAAYGAAWEAHDGAAAAALFTEDAAYEWGPFEAPLAGRAAIRERWEAATAGQGSVRFAAQPVGRDGDRAFVRWQVSLHAPGSARPVELDGIFVLDFAPDGLCKRLQEWWMTRPPADA
jgi:ketosteroid isomerase-like protein